MKTIVKITLISNGNNNIYRFTTESEAHNFFLTKRQDLLKNGSLDTVWSIEILTEKML